MHAGTFAGDGAAGEFHPAHHHRNAAIRSSRSLTPGPDLLVFVIPALPVVVPVIVFPARVRLYYTSMGDERRGDEMSRNRVVWFRRIIQYTAGGLLEKK